MELKQYLSVLWKWWWFIVLTTVVAAGSSYVAAKARVPVYQTSTTIMVGQVIQNPNPGAQDLYAGQQLAQTYAQVARRQPVLQATVDALRLPIDWQVLKGQVSIIPVAGTQLFEIRVVDIDPVRAKALADELARQVILQSPTPSQKEQSEHRQFVNEQLVDLKKKIEQASLDIAEMERSIASEVSARRIQDVQGQIAIKQAQMNVWQTNYSALLTFAQGGTNYLSIVEPATIPWAPLGSGLRTEVVLAAILGLMLSSGAAFVIEYIDDTIKDASDVERSMTVSTLGNIGRIASVAQTPDALITARHPKSSLAEEYRVLRTNLQFAALDNPASSLLVTSSAPREGKTTTVANLGVVIAQTGKRTLLVDTDLRRPQLHAIFAVSNRTGLTNLLLADQPDIANTVQPTGIPGLDVLTCGPQPPNPAELLASKKMDAVISSLQKAYDVIIYDSPPILAVADASILASKVREAIVVVDSGRTRADLGRKTKETLEKAGAKVLGVVLNRLDERRLGYGYYYHYYASNGERIRERRSRSIWERTRRALRRGVSAMERERDGAAIAQAAGESK